MIRKKFSKKLYEENDAKAKTVAKRLFLEQFKLVLADNEDKYGPDLIATDPYKNDEIVGYVECEVKHNWDKKEFPFSSIQIPERKKKFIGEQPIVFFMLNSNFNRALIIDGEDLIESPIVEVKNKYVPEGERFFQVPLKYAKFIEMR